MGRSRGQWTRTPGRIATRADLGTTRDEPPSGTSISRTPGRPTDGADRSDRTRDAADPHWWGGSDQPVRLWATGVGASDGSCRWPTVPTAAIGTP